MKPPEIQAIASTVVSTQVAAKCLQLTRGTLYGFAKSPNPPIKPIRIGDKFFWKVADIKNLLEIAE